ncbi:hypothetical protein C8Q80DRAFT_354873 [Daedaleopsis nitida]|nr:hypothetical protein C8Q80DRAFT_354873 [Daedaleopsis nitida]
MRSHVHVCDCREVVTYTWRTHMTVSWIRQLMKGILWSAPSSHAAITTACTTAWRNIQALNRARYAVVYSAGGVRWWHTSRDDPREHVTVRYLGAERPTRAHVYRDGTASIRPGTRSRRSADQEVPDEDYDSVPPFSDEEVEGDAEVPGN